MGRGSKATIRWKNDRVRKKKARDKRQAAAAHEARKAAPATSS